MLLGLGMSCWCAIQDTAFMHALPTVTSLPGLQTVGAYGTWSLKAESYSDTMGLCGGSLVCDEGEDSRRASTSCTWIIERVQKGRRRNRCLRAYLVLPRR